MIYSELLPMLLVITDSPFFRVDSWILSKGASLNRTTVPDHYRGTKPPFYHPELITFRGPLDQFYTSEVQTPMSRKFRPFARRRLRPVAYWCQLVDLRAVACSTAWGATDPGASRAARAYALELGVDGGHDTTCSLRTPDRVEERLAEIKADNTWSIKGRSCTGLAALERHAVASTPGANLLITWWIRRACVRG